METEKSIIKKFRKEIWSKFIKGINEFNLIEENDKIAVCISGGKDSFLLSKCLQELNKHGKIKFELKFILMNPGYDHEALSLIKENAEKLNINLHIFDYKIFEVIDSEEKPCYLCARMRRGALYNEAKSLNCNKIALGHHFNDVIETIMMSMIYNGEFKTMKPILDSTNFKGMKLIRPLYYIKEKDIKAWVEHNNLKFINCACKVTKNEASSKRKEIKFLIENIVEMNANSDKNIMNSTKEVNLNTILSYIEK